MKTTICIATMLLVISLSPIQPAAGQTDFCNYLYAQWSPDGEHIVFTAQCGQGQDILVANADGSNHVNLIQDGDLNSCPKWSPDGSEIAFVSNRHGNDDVYKMSADGSDLINLTNTEDAEESCPKWSPDGEQIAYIVDKVRSGGNLIVMNADGTNPVDITQGRFHVGAFQWSPDGNALAFSTTTEEDIGGDIYLSDDNGLINLTNTSSQETCPSWSPDGQFMVFSMLTEIGWGLRQMRADGSDIALFSQEPIGGIFPVCPIWSPDGQTLMFSVTTGMLTSAYRINADGSNLNSLLLPSPDIPVDSGRYYVMGWSPDGEKILFVFDRFSAEIFVANADGSDPIEIIGLE